MIGFDVGLRPLAGKHEHAVDSGIDAAGNVRIQPVTDDHRFLFPAAGALQSKLHHGALGFADHHRTALGGAVEHLAYAAAIGHTAVPCGADPIGIGGHKVHATAKQNARILQLLEGKLPVKAAQQHINVLLQTVGNGNPRRG